MPTAEFRYPQGRKIDLDDGRFVYVGGDGFDNGVILGFKSAEGASLHFAISKEAAVALAALLTQPKLGTRLSGLSEWPFPDYETDAKALEDRAAQMRSQGQKRSAEVARKSLMEAMENVKTAVYAWKAKTEHEEPTQEPQC